MCSCVHDRKNTIQGTSGWNYFPFETQESSRCSSTSRGIRWCGLGIWLWCLLDASLVRYSGHVPPGGGPTGWPRTRWRNFLPAVLGLPWDSSKRAGRSGWGEGSLGYPAKAAAFAPCSKSRRKWMDGWMWFLMSYPLCPVIWWRWWCCHTVSFWLICLCIVGCSLWVSFSFLRILWSFTTIICSMLFWWSFQRSINLLQKLMLE